MACYSGSEIPLLCYFLDYYGNSFSGCRSGKEEVIYNKLKEIIKPGCSIIEIGAHIGTDTKKLSKILQPDKFYAIEPDIRNVKALVRLRIPNITIINAAIGNQTSTQPFYQSYGNTPGGRVHTDSNSLMKPIETTKRPGWVKFRETTTKVYRLDTIVLGEIDLIWMDVQGAELLVIEGATETLKRTKYLYTECQEGRYEGQPGKDGILDALPNWELIFEDGDNILLRNNEQV